MHWTQISTSFRSWWCTDVQKIPSKLNTNFIRSSICMTLNLNQSFYFLLREAWNHSPKTQRHIENLMDKEFMLNNIPFGHLIRIWKTTKRKKKLANHVQVVLYHVGIARVGPTGWEGKKPLSTCKIPTNSEIYIYTYILYQIFHKHWLNRKINHNSEISFN